MPREVNGVNYPVLGDNVYSIERRLAGKRANGEITDIDWEAKEVTVHWDQGEPDDFDAYEFDQITRNYKVFGGGGSFIVDAEGQPSVASIQALILSGEIPPLK